MAELVQKHSIGNYTIIPTASPLAVAPSFTPINSGFMLGDVLMKALVLRFSGTVNVSLGGGTLSVVANQICKYLQSLTFGSDQHQNMIDNVDGLSLWRLLNLARRADQFSLDVLSSITTTGQFEVIFRIPFMESMRARSWDACVDLFRAVPYVRAVFNPASAIGSIAGGTNPTLTVGPFVLEATQEYYQGPFVDKKGQPAYATNAPVFMRYISVLPVPIVQSGAGGSALQINLPYGDRIYKRIIIAQRDTGTFAELNNTIIGVNDTDRVSLVLNGARIVDSVEWLSLQHQNQGEYYSATIPQGAAVIDFDEPLGDGKNWGSKASQELNLVTPNQNTFQLFCDVTKPSGSPALYIISDCMKPVPAGAIRQAPPSPPPAAK